MCTYLANVYFVFVCVYCFTVIISWQSKPDVIVMTLVTHFRYRRQEEWLLSSHFLYCLYWTKYWFSLQGYMCCIVVILRMTDISFMPYMALDKNSLWRRYYRVCSQKGANWFNDFLAPNRLLCHAQRGSIVWGEKGKLSVRGSDCHCQCLYDTAFQKNRIP